MREQLVFGDSYIEAELPDDLMAVPPGVSLDLEPIDDLDGAVRRALTEPLDLPPLTEVARGKETALIAFDDATVPCYAPLWPVALKAIIEALEAGGIARKNLQLVCANALHRQFPHEELAQLIGADLVDEFSDQLSCHDAEDPDGMAELGTTPNGYYVDVNRKVVETDLTVYLNCSTTRGFSGGWKSICVGLSSYRSIHHHHDPVTMSMSLHRNKMHEMLDEMGALVVNELGKDRIFKVETVLSNPLQVAEIFGGSVDATRAAALEINRSHMTDRRDMLEEKADVVLYGVPDWSPYAAFAHTNPILNLISTGLGYLGGMIEALGKPGCTVILANPCPERWDHQHHPSYKEVWDRVLPETTDPFEAREAFEPGFATRPEYIDAYRNNFGFHGSHGIMALYPLKRLRHASRVIVAGAEDPKIPQHVGFTATETVEDAIAEARSEHGADASVALVRYPAAPNR